MTRAKWIGVAAIGAALAAAATWAAHATPDIHVERAQVTAGPITRQVVAAGSVQAVTTVEIGAQVPGVVQSLGADFNTVVHAGQVIAHLDPRLYQTNVEQAQAGLLQAQAALGQAQADLTGFHVAEDDARTKLARAESLSAAQQLTDADLDAARIAVLEADGFVRAQEGQVAGRRADVDQARAVVTQAELNLDRTVIRSPIDGIVVDREVEVGQTLAVSLTAPVLFRIATDLTHVQVQVDIDESDVAGLTAGEPARFEVESYPGQTFGGTIKQLRLQPVAEQTAAATTVASATASASTSLVATVVGYTAIIDVANPDERLRPGMTAEVVLDGARRPNVVRIPNSALAFRPPADVLHVLKEPDAVIPRAQGSTDGADRREVWEFDGKRFVPVLVHVGLADGGWTELLSGAVHPGDALVTSAVLRQRFRL
jgi:HlyD family secretion protein